MPLARRQFELVDSRRLIEVVSDKCCAACGCSAYFAGDFDHSPRVEQVREQVQVQ